MNQEIWNRTEWFRKERFGMFIHWGLYAIPALGEWVMSEKRMTVEEYEKYFEQFDPTDYNPREWARLAKKAGMKYAVLTAKHHDGFCLFDSARQIIKRQIQRPDGIWFGNFWMHSVRKD